MSCHHRTSAVSGYRPFMLAGSRVSRLAYNPGDVRCHHSRPWQGTRRCRRPGRGDPRRRRFCEPRAAHSSRERVERAIHQAHAIGCNLVNMTVSTPASDPTGPGANGVGERISQGGSRYATEADFEITAHHMREVGKIAAGLGVSIAIEMHQHSIADNSWSTLHLLDLIGLPNVGCNPDLGNLYWCYEEPEESVERCIVALAPRAKYWHCKQLIRVHVPEVQKAYYIKVPLPDGDMDYRFAVAPCSVQATPARWPSRVSAKVTRCIVTARVLSIVANCSAISVTDRRW